MARQILSTYRGIRAGIWHPHIPMMEEVILPDKLDAHIHHPLKLVRMRCIPRRGAPLVLRQGKCQERLLDGHLRLLLYFLSKMR